MNARLWGKVASNSRKKRLRRPACAGWQSRWISAVTTKLAHGLDAADGSYSEVLAAPRRKESSSQLSSAC